MNDPAKRVKNFTRSEIELRSAKKIYFPGINIRFRKMPPNEKIYPAVQKAAQDMAVGLVEYCRLAVIEKLVKDGYSID